MSKVIWLTGLSGSGKTTIAHALKDRLEAQGKRIIVFDGDVVRSTMHKKLGFSRADIRKNNMKIARLALQKQNEADAVIVPVIAPYREDRRAVREMIGSDFIEVYLNCPLAQCIGRDVKGLYKRALVGEIKNFIGISPATPYEPPQNPEIEINTAQLSISQSVEAIAKFLEDKNLL